MTGGKIRGINADIDADNTRNKGIKRIKSENQGFTLMEILVATGIFAVFIVIITNVFQNVVEDQRRTVAMQNIQENLRYVLEVMSKELRHAKRSDGDCDASFPETFNTANRIFNTESDNTDSRIFFKNRADECISYYVTGTKLVRSVAGTAVDATPDELTVSGLEFAIQDNDIGALPGTLIQPLVTWKFQASFNKLGARYAAPITIQTTVSSRFYE